MTGAAKSTRTSSPIKHLLPIRRAENPPRSTLISVKRCRIVSVPTVAPHSLRNIDRSGGNGVIRKIASKKRLQTNRSARRGPISLSAFTRPHRFVRNGAAELAQLSKIAERVAPNLYRRFLVRAAHQQRGKFDDAQSCPVGSNHDLGIPEPAWILHLLEDGGNPVAAKKLETCLGISERNAGLTPDKDAIYPAHDEPVH